MMNMNYYQISAEELGKNAKVPLLKLGDSGEVFYEIALEMVNEIEKNNAIGRRTVFICPVGPVGQYPIFVRLVNERRLSLKNCWFINMDEYLTDDGEWIDESSALSFHGFMNRTVYSRIDPELVMPENQRIFPDPHDPDHIAKVIDELGGGGKPLVLVYNKCDQETDSDFIPPEAVRISAKSGDNIDGFLETLNGIVNAGRRRVWLKFPHSRAGELNNLYKNASVLETDYTDDGVRVFVECGSDIYGKYADFAEL